jgi:hypothetical protein
MTSTPGSKHSGRAVATDFRDHSGIQPHMLELSMNGAPWHPLYLKAELRAKIWNSWTCKFNANNCIYYLSSKQSITAV